MPLVKICGTTTVGDAHLAAAAGADYLGLILNHPASPRHVEVSVARQIMAAVFPVVAVTVNLPLPLLLGLAGGLGPNVLQLHGDESPELVRELKGYGLTVWKVLSGDPQRVLAGAESFGQAGADALLLDARETGAGGTVYGGTGQITDWALARELVQRGHRVVLAGGLTPDNLARAIETVQPRMVDAVSGVEAAKGVKDPDKVRAFVTAARVARTG